MDWLLLPSLNMTVYSQGIKQEKIMLNQVFDSVTFYRSQTSLYSETANLKPLCIARKVTNCTNQQNLLKGMKTILLIMITRIQKESRAIMMSGSCSEHSPTLKKNVPKWASYNSVLPVVNENPTDWRNLFTPTTTTYELRKIIYP